MSKKIWYRLLSKDGSIDVTFTSYTMMQAYWRKLSTAQALQCHWEVFEK